MGISLKEAEENSCAETVPTFTLSNHCLKYVSTISLLCRVKLPWSWRSKMDVSEVSVEYMGFNNSWNIVFLLNAKWWSLKLVLYDT